MKFVPFGSERSTATTGQREPSPEESLLLVEAFNRILNSEMRAEVMALAELHASHNPKFAKALKKLKCKH